MRKNGRVKIAEQEKLRFLSRVAVLSDLDRADLAKLAPSIRVRRHGPGKIFFMPPTAIGSIYFLFEGMVHLTHHTECGKRLVVANLCPGGVFGEKGLFGQGQATLAAEAISECIVGMMDKRLFSQLMQQNPQVSVRLMELLVRRMKMLEEMLAAVAFQPVRARLAHFLLNSAEKNGGGEEVKGLTHRDLGDMLGTYRETVTTTLGELRTRGLIDTDRKRIVLLDRDGLEHIAGDDR